MSPARLPALCENFHACRRRHDRVAAPRDLIADPDALFAAVTPRHLIVFLANPNNPDRNLSDRRVSSAFMPVCRAVTCSW